MVIHSINDKTLIRALFATFLGASFIAPAVATNSCATCKADLPSETESWELHGLPAEDDVHLNISGISLSADRSLMVVGTDEGAHIQVLRQNGEHTYALIPDGHFALAHEQTELDIEGIAGRGSEIWVIGSHSMKRKQVATKEELEEEEKKEMNKEQKKKEKKGEKKKDKKAKKANKDKKDGQALDEDYNHQRLNTVGIEPTREWLYRVRLDADGKVLPGSVVRGSLRDILANHPVLARFRNIPSKENGIDIEGLALMPGSEGEKKTKLMIGFRGPTLRGPLAVVLVVEAKEKSADDGTRVLKIKLLNNLYLGLDGRGIRGIGEVSGKHGGYLVLAGPVGDAPIPYVLYYWNGKDTVAEPDSLDAADNIVRVCTVPPPVSTPKAKAEGVQFLDEKDDRIRFLVVYDTGPNGAATAFSCGFRRP